ncbi:MAG: iron-containing alcohol dehydrogenase [Magnetovibrio sp.]|nr:iron-containing alcohol dehydrogenase [Magnetovibrio sp.]
MTELRSNWNYPTAVRFGAGRITELADACRALGMTKPLLVTDPGIAGLPMVADAVLANDDAGLPTGLYADVKPNPLGSNVDDGLAVYRDGGHDGVIAFGGGSAMDTGKLIAFMSGQTRPLWDFEDVGDNWSLADADGIAPIVAVPTTSGTGSEVGRAAVATDESSHTKKILFHPKMLPGIVICDPALVTGLPPNLTAWTGMDALAHCLEAYCAPGYHPMADGIAVEGLRLIREWLPRAVADGSDLEARAHMMSAAAMGATAFQKGLGAIHSLSHPVGSVYDTHHGLTNAVFMPYVLVFNRAAIAERMERLARWLGFANASFDAVLEWTLELRETFEIAHTAGELGVEAGRLETLAEMAAADPTAPTNPVPVGPEEMRTMYEAAMEGRL